jgi:hypothetical protein
VAKKQLPPMWKINGGFLSLPKAGSIENTGVAGRKRRFKKLCKNFICQIPGFIVNMF